MRASLDLKTMPNVGLGGVRGGGGGVANLNLSSAINFKLGPVSLNSIPS